MPEELELRWRKYELQRMRWRLTNRIEVDPRVLPTALDWLDGEIAQIEKALAG
ncbi:hypothetical protein L1N85_11240 [Paenibacillus alkaliterrae]|uniref:hypothetical protein n=1 Tax=Paenibacillus alkaliterrae TaxID=320909 RepID=UPI001F452504|nr:hypothetical protein [Paenibacillus alkaliterrae]MCF2939011.1 hypothetical protein [Paenibacillus alkaliterrae]